MNCVKIFQGKVLNVSAQLYVACSGGEDRIRKVLINTRSYSGSSFPIIVSSVDKEVDNLISSSMFLHTKIFEIGVG